MATSRPAVERDRRRRDEAFGHGTSLRGPDLEKQVATNATLQKQRWIDIYRRLWERKTKIDVADAVIIVGGEVRDWFFTSRVSGEIQRKSDGHLTPIAIKRLFVKKTEVSAVSRHLALLFHEDVNGGGLAYSLLSDLDFNLTLCQPSSPLWMTGFLLQPYLAHAHQHPQFSGTVVAKFSPYTAASTRVFLFPTLFHDLHQAEVSPPTNPTASRPHSAPTVKSSFHRTSMSLPRAVEDLVRHETAKLVAEVEAATRESIRQLFAEYQITNSHRLMLVRVSHVVFHSDLKAKAATTRSPTAVPRPMSAGPSRSTCAGAIYCDRRAFATGELNKTSTALSTSKELQQITRKSLHLCEEETQFLKKFGADAEATLEMRVTASIRGDASTVANAFKKLLQRRLFMLQSTLWNPESEFFNAKPLAWEDETKKQSAQYEMVRVCRTCYLIYHTMDAERFQATKGTVKAAARRLTMLHSAKLVKGRQRQLHAVHAWSEEEDRQKDSH